MQKRLLLVDDEQDIREILSLYMTDMGYEVLTAGDGVEAMKVFRKEVPPLVVADIRMPGIDGIELLRQIKGEHPDTEVIMITGHGDLNVAIRSLKYDATDFITKPINHDILDAALKRAYEKISMREQIRSHNENIHQLVQDELRVTRHKYHQLFEAAPCYISVQDSDLRITETNRLFKAHFGDAAGLCCYKAYKHRASPCESCPVLRTFEDGASHQVETVVTSQAGEQYHVLITTAPIRDAAGTITHVMEMSTDITRIRELQDRLTSLGLLIGSVSHGLKGLLTGLDGGMYLMKSGIGKGKTDQIEEGLDIVRQMGGRIRKQVLDILYYAKDRGLERMRTDVAEFAGTLVATVLPKAEAHRIRFIRDICADPGEFDVDPGVASSALVNILENAMDACMENASESPPQVLLKVRAEGDDIVFEIRDNGIGMDQETREKIFTLFFSSKGNKGTGLGLFIANQMVRRHGGRIDVVSEPGRGSTFTVRLPRKRGETDGAADR
ncbi:histidine kinase [Desulfonema ishimotonii]|uniref:histidine kinase n=1 Tax=Desulfonema ishimotonii TaxID=45657 RepID=A0A401FZF1_9BACT|nr:response regulator [Desulfonema ishimotonii]GBC62316.1 histidine kinase [Desulfonema ishimotonii]